MNNKKMLGYMYDFYNEHVLRGQNDDINYYKNQMKKYNSKNVLIVGAGTGRVAIPLNEVSNVVALDYDEGRLEVLKEKVETIKTICCDINNFETNEYFDMIIFPYSTLQFSNSPKKIDIMLKHLKHCIDDETIILFDISESFNTKLEKNNEFLFRDYCSKISDVVQVFYNSKRHKNFIEFKIEYKLEKQKVTILEHEKYYYYDREIYNKLFRNNDYNVINIDHGYGNGFYHKHIYHVKLKEQE